MAMSEAIRIKPHHLVDIIGRAGEAVPVFRPHPYGHAFHTVAEKVLADPDISVRMELGADDVCAPCSHNIAGRCDDVIDTSYRPDAPPGKREWNLLIDRRWCELLGLRQGDVLTARLFALRLRERMGDLGDVYREIPADRTVQRQRMLELGLIRLLKGEG